MPYTHARKSPPIPSRNNTDHWSIAAVIVCSLDRSIMEAEGVNKVWNTWRRWSVISHMCRAEISTDGPLRSVTVRMREERGASARWGRMLRAALTGQRCLSVARHLALQHPSTFIRFNTQPPMWFKAIWIWVNSQYTVSRECSDPSKLIEQVSWGMFLDTPCWCMS